MNPFQFIFFIGYQLFMGLIIRCNSLMISLKNLSFSFRNVCSISLVLFIFQLVLFFFVLLCHQTVYFIIFCQCPSQYRTSMTPSHCQASLSATAWNRSGTSNSDWFPVDCSRVRRSQSSVLHSKWSAFSLRFWRCPKSPTFHLWPVSWKVGSWCCRCFCRRGKSCHCVQKHVEQRRSLACGKICCKLWEFGTWWHCFMIWEESLLFVNWYCHWSIKYFWDLKLIQRLFFNYNVLEEAQYIFCIWTLSLNF